MSYNQSQDKKGSKGKTGKNSTDKKEFSKMPITNKIGRANHDFSSDISSRRKSNYLFDVQNKYGEREGGASPFNVNAYQDQVTDDYSVKSLNDLCMQIVTQALSKCYNIVP